MLFIRYLRPTSIPSAVLLRRLDVVRKVSNVARTSRLHQEAEIVELDFFLKPDRSMMTDYTHACHELCGSFSNGQYHPIHSQFLPTITPSDRSLSSLPLLIHARLTKSTVRVKAMESLHILLVPTILNHQLCSAPQIFRTWGIGRW